MPDVVTDASVTQIVTFLTVVIGFLVQIYRENRAREWATEDRARIAAELALQAKEQASDLALRAERTAAAVAVTARETAMKLQAHTEQTASNLAALGAAAVDKATEQLAQASAANLAATAKVGEHAKQAYEEANHVNAKIVATNESLMALGLAVKAGSDHAEHAFEEANHVNNKISDLNARLLKQGEQADLNKTDADATLGAIRTTGEASHGILRDNLVQSDKRQEVAAKASADAASTAADVATTAAKVASRAAGIAAGQLDSIQKTGEDTNEMVKGKSGGAVDSIQKTGEDTNTMIKKKDG